MTDEEHFNVVQCIGFGIFVLFGGYMITLLMPIKVILGILFYCGFGFSLSAYVICKSEETSLSNISCEGAIGIVYCTIFAPAAILWWIVDG